MRNLCILLLIVFLCGCVEVRAYRVVKQRVDTDIDGNQGYLSGSSQEEAKESKLGDTRTVSIVEIEFGRRKKKTDDLEDSIIYKEEIEEVYEVEEAGVQEEQYFEPEPVLEYKYYTVQKNDTLQKISHKFYGTTRKWELIYKNNKGIIKSPDKVYPGLRIKIPVEE